MVAAILAAIAIGAAGLTAWSAGIEGHTASTGVAQPYGQLALNFASTGKATRTDVDPRERVRTRLAFRPAARPSSQVRPMQLNRHPIEAGGLALYVLDLLLVASVLLLPLIHNHGDDRGDGVTSIVLPPPMRPKPWRRSMALLGVFAVLSFLYSAVFLVQVDHLYGQLVGGLATAIVHDSSAIGAYVGHAWLGTRFLYAALFVCFAVTVEASPARRLLMAAHAIWYLAMMACLDAGLLAVGVLTGAGIDPFGLLGNVVGMLVGVLAFFRLVFTSFQLPRPTMIPRRSRGHTDSWVTMLVLIAALPVLVLLVPIFRAAAGTLGLFPLVLSFYIPAGAIALIYTGLAGRLRMRGSAPPPASTPPPIDVITPAYNEEERLPRHLHAIDQAARRYGGDVRVVVCDDGSGDQTRAVAEASIKAMTAATGEVLTISHAGKSAALNAALGRTRHPLVIRIDADVEVDVDAFVHTHRWFQDPSVGMVGALNLPSEGSSWFHRMRELECLLGFGLIRRTLQTVNGIVCIPGTYAAFRRDVAVRVGGFANGMNGEDADLTMSFGRLGYGIILDPKVRVYEDVPPTLLEFREQRVRWGRAGVHVFARQAFFRAGFAGPRAWFSLTRQQASRVISCTYLPLTIYIGMLSMLVPGNRSALILVLAVPLSTQVVMVPVLLGLCLFYRRFRSMPFVLGWWALVHLKRVFLLESIFTIPLRPVSSLRFAEPGPVPHAEAQP